MVRPCRTRSAIRHDQHTSCEWQCTALKSVGFNLTSKHEALITCIYATAKKACDDWDGFGCTRRPGKGSLQGRQGLIIQHVCILEVVSGCHAYAECIVLPCGHALHSQRSSEMCRLSQAGLIQQRFSTQALRRDVMPHISRCRLARCGL